MFCFFFFFFFFAEYPTFTLCCTFYFLPFLCTKIYDWQITIRNELHTLALYSIHLNTCFSPLIPVLYFFCTSRRSTRLVEFRLDAGILCGVTNFYIILSLACCGENLSFFFFWPRKIYGRRPANDKSVRKIICCRNFRSAIGSRANSTIKKK